MAIFDRLDRRPASLVVFASYAVLIEAWRRVVLSMGETLAFLTATRIWFLASLGKYIPGKVWAVAGAAVLAQRAGVDPSVAVAGALVLQVLALASGAAVVAVTAGEAFQAVGQGATPIAGAVILLSLARRGRAHLSAVPRPGRPAATRSWPRPRAIPAGMVVAAFLANVVAWIGYGVALLLLARGLLPDVVLSLPQAIGVFTCSYLAGLPGAVRSRRPGPAGIGVSPDVGR